MSWKEIPTLDLQVYLTANDRTIFPLFQGNMMKAALGIALKKSVCASPKRDNCTGCIAAKLCIYNRLLSGKGDKHMPSLPYITLCNFPQEMNKGEEKNFRLRLFGEGVNSFPFFFFALQNMATRGLGKKNEKTGKRGTMTLSAIEQITPEGERKTLFSEKHPEAMSSHKPFPLKSYIKDIETEVTISTETPLRLKNENHLDDTMKFDILIRACMRRITVLSDEERPFENSRDIIQASSKIITENQRLHWKDYKRYSSRQGQSMNLGGITGTITYSDVPQHISDIAQAGSFLGIGKGLAFGFGQFQVTGH